MPHDAPLPESLDPLEQKLKEALRAERNMFAAWNNAKEHLRKVQEEILVEAEKAKKG